MRIYSMNIFNQPVTDRIGDLEYGPGHIYPFGATLIGAGVNFSVFSMEATSCTLVLYKYGQREPWLEIPFHESFRIGNVYAMMVYGLNIEAVEYGYRFEGPFDPDKGQRFDRNRVLLDPYARSVTGRPVWGVEPNFDEPFPHRGQIIQEDYDWQGDKPLEIPSSDLIIYEMHLRAFTRHVSSGVHYKGTFMGLREKIPYLKELGVNCVELMPIFAFDEFENRREIDGRRLFNLWGYSTIGFFAPKAGYAASARYGMEADELKTTIRRLHENGIQVILDVVFNHTAEGGADGPVISYKGIDNRTYYLLTPDGGYLNFSGCGNTMNCNNPVVRNVVIDCLLYWVSAFHVDGFRFDLASILCRDKDGVPMMNPPLLESIANDALLGRTLLIAEAWDAGGLYQVGSFPSWNRWAEWNGKYRDDLRRFLKGDGNLAWAAAHRLTGSKDLYDPSYRGHNASVNFLTCHDGFTLYDMYAYNQKHNFRNGWDNTDGADDNNSWNCGFEGETSDSYINNLRNKLIKNAFATLMCSRGPALFLAGDEFCNTQFGNNNAYCQDNIVSWLDWSRKEIYNDVFEFFKYMIAFRKRFRVITKNRGAATCTFPPESIHSAQPWKTDFGPESRMVAVMYAGASETRPDIDEIVYFAINAHWEFADVELPGLPTGYVWKLYIDTGRESSDVIVEKNNVMLYDRRIRMQGRSVIIAVAEKVF